MSKKVSGKTKKQINPKIFLAIAAVFIVALVVFVIMVNPSPSSTLSKYYTNYIVNGNTEKMRECIVPELYENFDLATQFGSLTPTTIVQNEIDIQARVGENVKTKVTVFYRETLSSVDLKTMKGQYADTTEAIFVQYTVMIKGSYDTYSYDSQMYMVKVGSKWLMTEYPGSLSY